MKKKRKLPGWGLRTTLEVAMVDAQVVTLLCDCRKGSYCPCVAKAMTILAEAISMFLTSGGSKLDVGAIPADVEQVDVVPVSDTGDISM